MLSLKQSCQLLTRWTNISKNCTILGHQRLYNTSKVNFFSRILGFRSQKITAAYLKKNEFLLQINQADVSSSCSYLTNIGITVEDIRRQPQVLGHKQTALSNRHEILGECGCSNVNVYLLNKFSTLYGETEATLKKVGVIDTNINLQQRLADLLNVEFHPCNEDASLIAVRMHFLRLFFVQNDFMTAKAFDDTVSRLPYVRFKSYQRTRRILEILTEKFHIPKGNVIDHINVLQADPDNLRKMLTIKPIGDVNITEILLRQPSLLLKSHEQVKKALAQLKSHGVSEELITNCPSTLTHDSNTIHSRLSEIKSRKELQAMDYHPNFLSLVQHIDRAQSRLDHLIELDKKCFNLSTLTQRETYFQKFIKAESNRNTSADCVRFLTKALKLVKSEVKLVKKEITRHPYFAFIPLTEIKQTIDMLQCAGFTVKDISANIHIVLYSGELILSRLKKFSESEQIGGHYLKDLSKNLQLKMIVYQIEAEFNFNGNGVWLDRKLNTNFD